MLSFSIRRALLLAASVVAVAGALLPAAYAQSKTLLRISTPAVPDDWHAKMWTVFKTHWRKAHPANSMCRSI